MNQIDELRQIIVGDNADLLSELKDRVESVEKRSKDVAEVLPAAIDERIAADNRLIDSLKKPVSIGLKQAIRDEPDAYAEILYPVMAPSIRRAISQAISSMLVTINQTIESATTAQGLALRIESVRTGIPYAQLILRKSATYTVEHIYLMDHDTGLLINEAHNMGADSLDGDAVSAMFSAIQSFVQDSFSHDKTTMLTDFKSEQQSARHNTWIVHGSRMRLACVILGDAPESLREKLYDVLDQLHVDFASQSVEFDGDASIFSGVENYIDPILHLDDKESETTSSEDSQSSSVVPVLIFAVLLCGLAFYYFSKYSRLQTVEHFLRQTPGVAVTDSYWDDGKIIIEGLQDPDAEVPYSKLEQEGIEPDVLVMNTIPFRSLEFSMELQRFKKEFALPRGVQFGVQENQISLYGESPIQWLFDNDIRIRQLSSDNRIDIRNLSASLNSVVLMLQSTFSDDELSLIIPSTNFVNEQLVVELTGSMPEAPLRLLRAMFAQSHWVNVTAN